MAAFPFLSFAIVFVLNTCLIIAETNAQNPSTEEATRKSQIYDNPRIFSEMSGAKRAALEKKFGKRPDRGVAFTGEEFTEQAMRVVPAPTTAIANTLVNNPSADVTQQDTQSETAVVFCSGQNVVAAYNDSGANVGGSSHFTGWALSTNGGASFTDEGDLPASSDGDAGDPVLGRSAKTGTIFLATLSFNTGYKLLIFRSTNNGVSFEPPVNGTPGFDATTGEQDKEWIAVDNYAGPGFGNVYMFWRNFAAGGGMTFGRSTDDGVTWGPNGGLKLANGSQGAFVTVGKDHAVYAFWFDQSVAPAEIKVRKSTDQGVSFAAAVTVAKLNATGSNGDLGLNPGFRTNTFPQAVCNPTNANQVFVVYNDRSGAGSTLDRGNIYLVSSADGGASWSAPTKVNDDAALNDQWQPAIAVSPHRNELCVSWYDRRLDSTNQLIDRYAANGVITPGGTVSLEPNVRVSSQSFPAVVGADPGINSTYMGDYDQVAADDDHFGLTWGDNRDNSAGHAGKNPNVRYATIPRAQTAETRNEIAVDHIPQLARDALDLAVSAAPADVLARPVKWSQAFEVQESIALYQLKGTDAKGHAVETEVKGTRVIELEVNLPQQDVPQPVRANARASAPSISPNRLMTAVIVGDKVVAYSTIGEREPIREVSESLGPIQFNFAPTGELISPKSVK